MVDKLAVGYQQICAIYFCNKALYLRQRKSRMGAGRILTMLADAVKL